MSEIRLPQYRSSAPPRTSKQYDNSDAILKVMSTNPYAQAIDQITPILAQALQKRAELRKQAQQVASLAQAAGEDSPPSGLDANSYEKLLTIKGARSAKLADAAKNRTDLEFKLEGLRAGYTDRDPITGREQVHPGVQGLSIVNDENGNPSVSRANDYAPRITSPGGKGGGLGMLTDPKIKKSLLEKFNAEQTVRRGQTSIDSARMIKGLVSSQNPIAVNAIPTYMARASGEVGNLSEADKAPFGGSQAILSRLENALMQKATGKLTAENSAFINDVANLMEGSATSNIDSLAKIRSAQYSQLSPGLREDDLYNLLRPKSALQPIPAPSQQVGKIRVRNKATGQTGSLSEQFFDPAKYERIQ